MEPTPAAKWGRVRRTLESIALILGLPAAAVAAGALVPQAIENVSARSAERATLERVEVGQSVEYLRSTLGVPVVTGAVPETELRRSTYVGQEWAVTALFDTSERAVALTIFACEPGLKPQLTTPSGTRVRLNSAPLAEAERWGSKPADINDRIVRFSEASTGGSVGQIVEKQRISGSNAADGHTYMLGVSSACGADVNFSSDPTQAKSTEDELSEGDAARLQAYRRSHAPNFYFESVDPELDVDYVMCLQGPRFPSRAVDFCARPAPMRQDLPRRFAGDHILPWWRRL